MAALTIPLKSYTNRNKVRQKFSHHKGTAASSQSLDASAGSSPKSVRDGPEDHQVA